MRRNRGWMVPVGAALALGVTLGGCSAFDRATSSVADAFASGGERIGAPWGGARPRAVEEGDTIARVRGVAGAPAPLRTEDGDVWPAAEAPRATLANPDAALRNIPTYRPGELDRMSAPAGRSEWQPSDPPPVRGAPPDLRGSSTPPSVLNPPPEPERPRVRSTPPPLPPVARPPRTTGQVYQTPSGPVVSNGGTETTQTVIGPNGQIGTAVRDGNTTTVITPGGGVQTVPTPR